MCLQLYITFGHGEAEARLVLPAFLRVYKSRADARLPLIKFAVVVDEAIHKLYGNVDACRCLIDLLTVHKELGHSCGLIDQIRFSIFCAQAHVACGHFKGEFFAGLPIRVSLCDVLAAGPLLELFGDLIALGKLDGHLGARQIDAGGFAGVAVLVHDGAAVHGEVVQLLVISGQGHVACGHGEGEIRAVLPISGQVRGLRAAGKLPAIKFMVRIEEGVRRFHRDGFTFQRLCARCAVDRKAAPTVGHRQGVDIFVRCGQAHVACGHFKGKGFAVLPAAIRRCGCSAGIRPFLELFSDISALGKCNGHLGARQIDAGVAVSAHDGAAGHGEVVQLLVISFQGHIACGHGEGEFFAGLPVIRRVHRGGTVTGKLPAIKFMVLIEEGVRRFHRDGFTFQRLCALLIVHKNRASVLVHRHIVNRFVFSFQGHVACGHFKGKGVAVSPIRGSIYDVIAAGPLLELILDTRALGKPNGHLGARQVGAGGLAGLAGSVHDGAAGHLYLVLGNGVIAGPQRYIACRHFKGEFFACLPTIGQACGLRAAERPLLELLCSRVRRGRNGHRFARIELGVLSAAGRCGDTFRQGKGVKGVGFDAQIRRCAADGAAGMELATILCGLVEIALALWRRIGDVLCRLAVGVRVDDFYLIGIFNGRIAGNDRFRSLASCYGNAAAPFYIQSAENRRAAAVGNGNGSGGVNACTTLHKGRTAALIAGNDHLTGAVFHGEFVTGHLTIRVAQLHFAGAGQGDIAADSRRVGGAAAHLHSVAVMYGQIAGHGKAGVVCVGNVHRAFTGDLGTAANRVAAFAAHRNIAGAAGVIHGQLAAHGNAEDVFDVHCTATGNVGILLDGIAFAHIANNGNAAAFAHRQVSFNGNCLAASNIHHAVCCNRGIAFDRSVTITLNRNFFACVHIQAAVYSTARDTGDLYSTAAGDRMRPWSSYEFRVIANDCMSIRTAAGYHHAGALCYVQRAIHHLARQCAVDQLIFHFHSAVAGDLYNSSRAERSAGRNIHAAAACDRYITSTFCVIYIHIGFRLWPTYPGLKCLHHRRNP